MKNTKKINPKKYIHVMNVLYFFLLIAYRMAVANNANKQLREPEKTTKYKLIVKNITSFQYAFLFDLTRL